MSALICACYVLACQAQYNCINNIIALTRLRSPKALTPYPIINSPSESQNNMHLK